jgi:hypothetical protein
MDDLLWSLRCGAVPPRVLAQRFETGSRALEGTAEPFLALQYQGTLRAARDLVVGSSLDGEFLASFHALTAAHVRATRNQTKTSLARIFFWLGPGDLALVGALAASDVERGAARCVGYSSPAVVEASTALSGWFCRQCLAEGALQPPEPCTWSDVARELLFVLEKVGAAQQDFPYACAWWCSDWGRLERVYQTVAAACARLYAHAPAATVLEQLAYGSSREAGEVVQFLLLVERYLGWNVPWPFFPRAANPCGRVRYADFVAERALEWLADSAERLAVAVPNVWAAPSSPAGGLSRTAKRRRAGCIQ